MIINFPPATWDGYQNINPEKLNRNITAARAALAAWGERRWIRNTVSHRVGTVTVAAPSSFHIPVVQNLPYIIDRITVYGDITGDTTYLRWGMASTFSSEGGQIFPLNPGTAADTSPSRGTVLPGYAVAAGTDWSDSFRIDVGTTSGSVVQNIIIEVALRYDRAPGLDSDPYNPDVQLYRSGDALTAERFNGITSALELYAAIWSLQARRIPSTMYYVQVAGISSTNNATSRTVPLPGSGGETMRRILARAKMDGTQVGLPTQTVAVAASYGTWNVTTPVQRLSFSIDGLNVATGSSGALNIADALRSPTNPADDLLIRPSTSASLTIDNVGVWIVKTKIL